LCCCSFASAITAVSSSKFLKKAAARFGLSVSVGLPLAGSATLAGSDVFGTSSCYLYLDDSTALVLVYSTYSFVI
jgi:hypothetical protein